jgi:hypothetical protein
VCEREWEVSLKLEMVFKSCSYVGSGVGVSIYRWGSKTDLQPGGQTNSQSASLTGRLQVRLFNRS